MALSYVDGAAGTNTVTFPSFQDGDLAIMFAFRDGSATNPTVASGWTTITNTTDGTSCSISVAWRRLRTGDTAGTFTNASRCVCAVYRGAEPFVTPIGGVAAGAGTTNALSYTTITMSRTNSTSWVVGFGAHRSVDVNVETPPTGMTYRTGGVDATAEAQFHDTNGAVNSWPTTAITGSGTASGWQTYTLEVLAMPTQAPNDLTQAPLVPVRRRA